MAKILIADDHPLNRHFLGTLLSYRRHQVIEAADGVEALAETRRHHPDLIIADVAMPRMDGPSFVRAMRADPDIAAIPVVFYTASYREEESRAIARDADVEYVITKPSDPEVILQVIDKALGEGTPQENVEGSEKLRAYAERLQATSIRMSALIELGLELHGESDPHGLVQTAARAVRTIFAADYAVIEIDSNTWSEGDVDEQRVANVRKHAGSRPYRDEGLLYLPMLHRFALQGWMLLGHRNGEPFSLDDERLAGAAASEVRAARENLMLHRAQRQARVDVEEELRSSRADMAAVFEASPLPIVTYDRGRIVRSWNPAAERTYGWSAAEVVGRPNPSIPPDVEEEFAGTAEECLSGNILSDVEIQRVRKDGTRRDVSLSMAPLYDPVGSARGFVSISSDITERRRAELELRSSRERLRSLSARILSIQEEERTRIARELHDDLAQLLTAIRIDASRLVHDVEAGVTPPPRVLTGIVPLIDQTLDSVSRLVSQLRTTFIAEVGLAAAIERKLAVFEQRTEIATALTIEPRRMNLSDEVATAAFRIFEEALTNVARHAGATRVEVSLHDDNGELLLEIRDNGRGIRENERVARNAHGLVGMRERAEELGGDVTIGTVKGDGTFVRARIPYAR